MFFKPQLWNVGVATTISNSAKINGASGYAVEVLEGIIRDYGMDDGKIDTINVCCGAPEGATVDIGNEGYAIIISDNTATLYQVGTLSQNYAAVTLLQMCESNELCECRLEDAPDSECRGYRFQLPGRDEFDDYKKLMKTLIYYKYNNIGFELYGAMEYKRRPEINEAWLRYVADVTSAPNRCHDIVFSKTWPKDSIHWICGGGKVISQDEVRELVEYSKSFGFNVIPEVPTLSHTDYLCQTYPEIAERHDDDYPDAYCPNHPEVYNIVFDVLEEVIDVFKPNIIHIGHDELYSVGICERCKNTPAHELFANDVIKIHDFLAAKGIKTMMWGDRLLPVVLPNGRAIGGAGTDYKYDTDGVRRSAPATFWAQGMLPKDIIMVNWYYSFGVQYDYVFHTQGYKTVFGNLYGTIVDQWRFRRNLGTNGGIVSNWGNLCERYMQRGGQFKEIIFTAYALWSTEYDTPMKNEMLAKVFAEALRLHFGNMGDGSLIAVTHSTEMFIPYKKYYVESDVDYSKYHMGKYVVTYDDNTTAELEVCYGVNILSDKTPMKLIGSADGEEKSYGPEYDLTEVCYSTMPIKKFGKTCFKAYYENPHPEKNIVRFEYVSECDTPVELIAYERV